ncbi:hypothetical protein GCM10027256_10910 [Novispirillum itersonii subsp. nipponicum]
MRIIALSQNTVIIMTQMNRDAPENAPETRPHARPALPCRRASSMQKGPPWGGPFCRITRTGYQIRRD